MNSDPIFIRHLRHIPVIVKFGEDRFLIYGDSPLGWLNGPIIGFLSKRIDHVVRIGQTWSTSVERLMDVFELIRFEGFIIKGSDLKINELVSLYCYS